MTKVFGACDTCGFDGDQQTPELRDVHLGHIAHALGQTETFREYMREKLAAAARPHGDV